MTDDAHMSSDEESPQQNNSAETAALARKRRLMALKTRIHGVEMTEEDYNEEAKQTKKSKTGDSAFRSYQPVSDVLPGGDSTIPLDLIEKDISEHLQDTKDTKPIENIDLTTLAPKKIDWDLKRDIAPKLEKLERRTQRAIAQIIRQRLAEGVGDLSNAVNNAEL